MPQINIVTRETSLIPVNYASIELNYNRKRIFYICDSWVVTLSLVRQGFLVAQEEVCGPGHAETLSGYSSGLQ